MYLVQVVYKHMYAGSVIQICWVAKMEISKVDMYRTCPGMNQTVLFDAASDTSWETLQSSYDLGRVKLRPESYITSMIYSPWDVCAIFEDFAIHTKLASQKYIKSWTQPYYIWVHTCN